MKKIEILSLNWLRKQQVATCGHDVTIRELSAAKRNEIRSEYSKMKESSTEADANEYLVRSYCFSSVVDDDGIIVFESDDEQKQALDQLPNKWFADVFAAIAELNDMTAKTDEVIEKKSDQSTEAQTISSGSDGSVESSVTPVSEECLPT
jgi:hypothetical protein